MMMQVDLFDSLSAEAARRDAAIAKTEAANTPTPMDRAKADAIANLAGLPDIVSADTILPDLTIYDFTDPRAMGSVMRYLSHAGYIRAVGWYRKSTRSGSHLRPTAVYQNLAGK